MGSTTAEFKNRATATLLELAKNRRTIYALTNESPVSNDAIETIIKNAVLHVPSSFNTQTTRIILLLGEEHQRLWDITLGAMENLVAAGVVPRQLFETHSKPKLSGFRAAYGTVCFKSSCRLIPDLAKVLFFIEYDALTEIKKKFPTYANKFDPYALESNAMSQYLSRPFFSIYFSVLRTPTPAFFFIANAKSILSLDCARL
jgi:predicted oxidoreductase (fatty acid repression mutant protein)